MKGYLVLSDGSIFNGKVADSSKNVLGKIVFDHHGAVSVNHYKECSTCISNQIALSDIDWNNIKSKFNDSGDVLGKIVVDALPVDFHMYDLKTA